MFRYNDVLVTIWNILLCYWYNRLILFLHHCHCVQKMQKHVPMLSLPLIPLPLGQTFRDAYSFTDRHERETSVNVQLAGMRLNMIIPVVGN